MTVASAIFLIFYRTPGWLPLSVDEKDRSDVLKSLLQLAHQYAAAGELGLSEPITHSCQGLGMVIVIGHRGT